MEPRQPNRRRRVWPFAAMALAGLAACDADAMRPSGAAAPGEGRLIAVGGGPHGAQTACFSCHGLAGQGDGGATPRLAGLPKGYLEKQLHDYALKRRPDAQMSPIAKGLTVEQRRAVAGYYAALPPAFAPRRPADPAVVAKGERLYAQGAPERGVEACDECHGAPFDELGPGMPPLGGQPAGYTVEQFERWRLAERRNDPRGVMLTIAQRLREDEVEALAAYLASVRP